MIEKYNPPTAKIIPFSEGKKRKVEERGAPNRIDDLYRTHWAVLCKRLRRVFGAGPPEPEDLAQIAFTKLIELENGAGIASPGGFLFRVALNAGLDATRKTKNARKFIDEELALLDEDGLEKRTPSHVYESKQYLAAAQLAIGALPPKQREILLRSRIKGETYAQISDATGWSLADISRQLNAAVKAVESAVQELSGADSV